MPASWIPAKTCRNDVGNFIMQVTFNMLYQLRKVELQYQEIADTFPSTVNPPPWAVVVPLI
jgi:hypothetical protein